MRKIEINGYIIEVYKDKGIIEINGEKHIIRSKNVEDIINNAKILINVFRKKK